jgi:hypothetical protein
VKFDHSNGAVFEIHPSHNNITFRGDGIGKSILSFRTWSGGDPMDYEVDVKTKTIIRTSIARNSAGRYSRGSLFVMKQVGTTEFDSIHWEGLEMRGNTVANGKHGWYTPYDDLEEWDISNKGIVFTFGAKPMHNISVRNCAIHGWRGEILYKGGSNPAHITIENCDIYETNSSAVSISGNMILRDSRIWNAYNGVENYCDTGQFSEVYNVSIDLDRSFKGTFGIAYLGTEEAYLIVDGCEINGGKGAIFFSDFAHNVEIRNNTIKNSQWGIYANYMNLYKLPGAFNSIEIVGNTFEAGTRNMDFAILNSASGVPVRDWVITGNRTVNNGAVVSTFIASNHPGPRAEHNVVLRDNVIPGSLIFAGEGLVPEYVNNQSKMLGLNSSTAVGRAYTLVPSSPEIEITFVKEDGLKIAIENLGRYPEGHDFTLSLRDKREYPHRGLEVDPGAWNNLARGYALYDDASITLEMGADGVFHLVNYSPPVDSGTFTVASGTEIAARGREEIYLQPAAPTIYESFSGIPVNVPVTVRVNANVRFANNNSIRTPNGTLFTPEDGEVLFLYKDSEGVLHFIEGVELLEITDGVELFRGESTELAISVKSEVPVMYEWFEGSSGNTRNPINKSSSGKLQLQAFDETGKYSYWARLHYADWQVDSPTMTVIVVQDPRDWEILPDFLLSEASSVVISEEENLTVDNRLEIPMAYVPNRWIDLDDTVLRLHPSPISNRAENPIFWGPPSDGATFFLRFRLAEVASESLVHFYSTRKPAFIDVPVFTLRFKPDKAGFAIKGPGSNYLSNHLEVDRWYDLFVRFQFDTGTFRTTLSFPRGVDSASNTFETTVTREGVDSRLKNLNAIRRVSIVSPKNNQGTSEGGILFDDFWFKRTVDEDPAPVNYSFWQDIELDPQGIREIGLGRIVDRYFPWIYFPESEKWLYVYTDYSNRRSLWGLLAERGGRVVSLVYTGEQFNGWYYPYRPERSTWKRF